SGAGGGNRKIGLRILLDAGYFPRLSARRAHLLGAGIGRRNHGLRRAFHGRRRGARAQCLRGAAASGSRLWPAPVAPLAGYGALVWRRTRVSGSAPVERRRADVV